MKTKSILIILLALSISAYGQTEKGHFLLGGSSNLNLNFVSTSYSSSSSGTYNAARDETKFNFNPTVGYFVADDFALGLLANYSSVSGERYSISSLLFGPFMRYYFLKSEKIFPFTQFTIDYGSNKREQERLDVAGSSVGTNVVISDIFAYELDLGISIMLSKSVSFDVIAGYAHAKETMPSIGYDGKEYERYTKTGAFGINFGFSLFLGNNM